MARHPSSIKDDQPLEKLEGPRLLVGEGILQDSYESDRGIDEGDEAVCNSMEIFHAHAVVGDRIDDGVVEPRDLIDEAGHLRYDRLVRVLHALGADVGQCVDDRH
jgi:hypothetical protein